MVREKDKSVISPGRPNNQMKVQYVEAPKERKRDKLEERSKDWDKKSKGSEGQPIEERKKEIPPAEKRRSDDKNGLQQDRQAVTPKEKEGNSGNTTPVGQPSQKREQRQLEQQNQQPAQPKQEVLQPERTKKREATAPQGLPEQPNVKQKASEPVRNGQIQRDERQQKQQVIQPDKKDITKDKQKEIQEKKELRKKAQEEKEGAKPSGEGIQQRPVGNGTPAPR